MSSSTCNNLLRVFKKKSRKSHQQPSSSSAENEPSHYQHGIPGIPTDGKVVLLMNSSNGAQIYLIGTLHGSKQSAETVKKVIDYVRPNVVAVELCEKRAMGAMNKQPDKDTWYKLFRKSIKAPGGLSMMIYMFMVSCRRRRLHAYGIIPGLEFKVAIEESSRVGASCFYFDQDINVTHEQLSKVPSFDLLWKAYCESRLSVHADLADEKYTRSSVREVSGKQKKRCPDIFKVIIEDRDKFMSINLRSFQGEVVAVVGLAHMDGIELLWKLAEEDDNCKLSFKSEIEGHSGQGGYTL
ncbi:traB domain-containing protein-like [Papaver somniferum]|nr:traB domain-containing protein-like [Papaver somniferum]